ncbi:hypothetical protein [Budvicia aquatica]|uniref:hypothetical protein n=1 Tax=Budvicia aquatica TaxID=82979 RepID=UPI0021C45A09|nr:hypothetical protein [Budvicia aquatica]
MKVTGLDIMGSVVTLLAIAVMIPMPWLLSSSRDADGPLRCAPVSVLSEPPSDSITALWLASFPAPVKTARETCPRRPSASITAKRTRDEPVSWHQIRYDDE